MSLHIDVDNVTSVLLADGWHDVAPDTFDLDSYEYVTGDVVLHGGGRDGICSTGFAFTEQTGRSYAGPLTSILAITVKRKS